MDYQRSKWQAGSWFMIDFDKLDLSGKQITLNGIQNELFILFLWVRLRGGFVFFRLKALFVESITTDCNRHPFLSTIDSLGNTFVTNCRRLWSVLIAIGRSANKTFIRCKSRMCFICGFLWLTFWWLEIVAFIAIGGVVKLHNFPEDNNSISIETNNLFWVLYIA